VRLRGLKATAAALLTQPWVGRAAAALLRDRIPWRGSVVLTDDASVEPRTKAMLLFRIYESAEARFVARYLSPDRDVLELGSSLGAVSGLILRKLAPQRRLVAVEANPRLLPLLRRNLARNASGRAFEIEHAAVHHPAGDAPPDEVELLLSSSSLCSRVGDAAQPGERAQVPEPGQRARVPAVRLRELVARHRLARYSLVSDIEGAEAGILLREDLALRSCDQLIIELHQTEHEGVAYAPDDLAALLTERHVFRLRDRYGNVAVFER
jgi:FkbM family methyltransferase